ncbi:uncharacterized protein PV06_07039 [Exophiala oligosperma]|uniref:Uncharacterized protein n=1 Tax=Exophiala oligosperma TaxID=215243 RepID=A0A0D2DER2_9EURO|nr:uncharacterized protein PV06_07039 [Exophiala oligosperma]KIW41488.1 hypothetical protein PV06_07039 [Exophiala oligosperma]
MAMILGRWTGPPLPPPTPPTPAMPIDPRFLLLRLFSRGRPPPLVISQSVHGCDSVASFPLRHSWSSFSRAETEAGESYATKEQSGKLCRIEESESPTPFRLSSRSGRYQHVDKSYPGVNALCHSQTVSIGRYERFYQWASTSRGVEDIDVGTFRLVLFLSLPPPPHWGPSAAAAAAAAPFWGVCPAPPPLPSGVPLSSPAHWGPGFFFLTFRLWLPSSSPRRDAFMFERWPPPTAEGDGPIDTQSMSDEEIPALFTSEGEAAKGVEDDVKDEDEDNDNEKDEPMGD